MRSHALLIIPPSPVELSQQNSMNNYFVANVNTEYLWTEVLQGRKELLELLNSKAT